MAKRSTGVGRGRKINHRKTKKRLEAKRLMLVEKMARHPKHARRINAAKLKAR